MELPISRHGSAGWFFTGAILFGLASKFSRWPRQRAGFSPCLNLLVVA
jgi:hypothetical protein